MDECEEIRDTLKSEINLLRKTIDAKDGVISIATQDSVIMGEMNATLKKTNDDLEKAVKKEKRKSFFKGAGFGIGAVIVIEAVAATVYIVSNL